TKIVNIDSTINFDEDKKFNYVYSEPPFMNMPPLLLKEIGDKAGESYIDTRSNLFEWVFVNRVINSLEDEGIGVVVLRYSALYSQKDEDIRKELINQNLIKAVIQLPAQLIPATGISTSLLVIQKQKSDVVTFVDASNEFVEKSRTKNKFDSNNI